MSVLVIEDDDDLRSEIVEYLERRGRRLTACASLAAAREVLETAIRNSQPPKAIICDMSLPDGDGLEIYLAFAPRLLSSRWILMSGSLVDSLEKRVKALGLPRPTIVEKPIPMRTLHTIVDEVSRTK